jgi:hypothetical protein
LTLTKLLSLETAFSLYLKIIFKGQTWLPSYVLFAIRETAKKRKVYFWFPRALGPTE